MTRRGNYMLRGRVVDATTRRPLPGLHVRGYDRDCVWDDCLGSDDTDASGAFEIRFFDHDFKEPFEGDPEVYVTIYNAGKKENRELHRSAPVRMPRERGSLVIDVAIEAGPLATEPRINRVDPEVVSPGAFVDIYGDNLGEAYKDTTATVGGREALVLEVTPSKVAIRIPPERGSLDPLTLTVAGRQVIADELLRYRDPPRQGHVGEAGAPETFTGGDEEGAGLANVGGEQRVLIIMCYPQDKDPTMSGLTAAEERQRQQEAFEKLVNPAFRQMSYNRTDFDFDYTDWFELPDDDTHYFWRQSDIDDAQDVLDNLPADATEAEIETAEAVLETAKEKVNLMKEKRELYHDALKVAEPSWTLTDYAGIMVLVATEHLRGQASGEWDNVTDLDGDTVTLTPNTYLWVISHTAHWGRRIHELGHAIASRDLYGRTGFIADGRRWDMMGKHNRVPLFSGYNMVDKLDWYVSPDPPTVSEVDANVKNLVWTDAPNHDQVYELRAHDVSEDASANMFHIIKLQIFPGLTYYVEVRQQPVTIPTDLATTTDSPAVLGPAAAVMDANPAQLLFDTQIDFSGTKPAHGGGVIVTKVVDDDSTLNQRMRRITLLSPEIMQAGDEVVDAARRLTIQVDSKINDRPLTYKVRVKWTDVATADPNGLFNIRIRDWDSSWQTNDIWVDSEANGFGTFETSLEPGTGNPTGNGDRPWVNNWNQIHARIYNDGWAPANDVQVTFYVNSPPAIGDNGTWVPHAVKTIPTIAANGSESVFALWYPQVGEHTCLKVVAETQLGETAVNDNGAQENVFNFDTSGSSPHQPILFEANVQNPLREWTLIQLHARGLPIGWESTVEHGWIWLPPLGEKKMRIALFTDIGRDTPLTAALRRDKQQARRIPPEINFLLEGAVYTWYGEGRNVDGEAEHLEAIGGLQVKARARRLADISLAADKQAAANGFLVADGAISTGTADVPITLQITFPNARPRNVTLITDAAGRFQYSSREHNQELDPGRYTLQAFIIVHNLLADAESDIVKVEV